MVDKKIGEYIDEIHKRYLEHSKEEMLRAYAEKVAEDMGLEKHSVSFFPSTGRVILTGILGKEDEVKMAKIIEYIYGRKNMDVKIEGIVVEVTNLPYSEDPDPELNSIAEKLGLRHVLSEDVTNVCWKDYYLLDTVEYGGYKFYIYIFAVVCENTEQ